MAKVRSPQFCLLLLPLLLFAAGCEAHPECQQTKCGRHGPPIRFPFYLKDQQPHHCGFPGFHLSCTNDHQTVLELPAHQVPARLYLHSIDYKSQNIIVYDPQNCLAEQILTLVNSSSPSIPFHFNIITNVSFFSCPSSPCGINAIDSDWDIEYSDYMFCTKILDVQFPATNLSLDSYFYLDSEISMAWSKPDCTKCEANGKRCGLMKNATQDDQVDCFPSPGWSKIKLAGIILGSFFTIVIITICGLYIRKYKSKKDFEIKLEVFLEDYRALKPTRYSYADIKRITNKFTEELGQGAYGKVFKGKLSNDICVAVKILNDSKGNGEEFINEVGTMGSIHHVNVVRLVGFCADGFWRALVYEFLPNGSLEKFICSPEKKTRFLGWEKLQDIALGIARGIEYLHEGCEQQILHFDIKPHNILLDLNHSPKISDFGLAKLCSKDQSAVSMTTARGTIGYIAPEVFSRNFGKVSFKSDVYSFGILLLEMVSGRKNEDTTAQESNQIYYPQWIYSLLEEGEEEVRIEFEEEKESEIAKKLAIVGLCCIQWHPIDRPCMKSVVQMLEGDGTALLSVPPNPFTSATPKRSNAINPQRLKQKLEIIPELE